MRQIFDYGIHRKICFDNPIKDSSPYKIKRFGEALAWEYLRTMGIDGAKPDTHLRRFLGSGRMGTCLNDPATVKDVREQVEVLSQQTGLHYG